MVSSVFSGQQRSTVSTSQYQTLLHTTENSPITDNVHKHRIECSPSKHSGITYGSANHLLINACVFGVPKPVTGSHRRESRGTATLVSTRCDIIKRPLECSRINLSRPMNQHLSQAFQVRRGENISRDTYSGVDESNGRFPRGDSGIIHQCQDGTDDRRRS